MDVFNLRDSWAQHAFNFQVFSVFYKQSTQLQTHCLSRRIYCMFLCCTYNIWRVLSLIGLYCWIYYFEKKKSIFLFFLYCVKIHKIFNFCLWVAIFPFLKKIWLGFCCFYLSQFYLVLSITWEKCVIFAISSYCYIV